MQPPGVSVLGVSHPISCLAGKQSNSITVQDGQCLLRMGGQGKRQYMCFDEAFFKNLEKIQWNRDNGYVELVPILVVIPDV